MTHGSMYYQYWQRLLTFANGTPFFYDVLRHMEKEADLSIDRDEPLVWLETVGTMAVAMRDFANQFEKPDARLIRACNTVIELFGAEIHNLSHWMFKVVKNKETGQWVYINNEYRKREEDEDDET